MTNIVKHKGNWLYTEWALTITLKPNMTNGVSACEQYNIVMPDIIGRLQNSNLILNSLLAFEVTKSNDIHMHLLLKTKKLTIKQIRFHLDCMIGGLNGWCYGFYYLKPINDLLGWISYINKDPFYIESHEYAF